MSSKILVLASTLLSGLVAGLLYGFACSVNPGLHRLGDKEYLEAMRSINAAILNPVFFASFIGVIAVFAVTVFQLKGAQPQAFYCLLAAAIIYLVGVFGVTIFANVPLNDRLAGFHPAEASRDALANMRDIYEGPWNTFHLVRTLASIISFGLCIVTLIKIK